MLFSMMAALCYLPTNSAQRVQLAHILDNTCFLGWLFAFMVLFFDNNHSNGCEMISYCGFDSPFPDS